MSYFDIPDLPRGTQSGQPYAKPIPAAPQPPNTPKSAKHTTSFPPFAAINTPLPDHLEMSTRKSMATGAGEAAGAPQFVSLDQLAALLQAMNRPLTKEEKTSEDTRTDRAIALADALSKYQKLGRLLSHSWRKTVSTGQTGMPPSLRRSRGFLSSKATWRHHQGSTLALLLHQRCQPHFQAIANALEARIAVDASKPINSKTILELAGRFATAGVAADSLVFAYRAQRGPDGPTAGTSSGGQQGSQQGGSRRKTMEGKSNSWARRVLTKANPCQWCYEWGHWAKDCPLKKAKKPLVVDPRLQNPGYRLKRLTVCHPGLLQRGPASATVASVKKQPSGEEQALIDSNATDSVTNNVRFLPLCGQFA
ncbi:hypothetical protein PCASD_04331 [Puccinia coronata f. sp. avenae]|uniref:CCHC-type domain-containing protein n=1 Tax=Puccinia coronata f. sp. avenae TaxID=200324 RepID=A0A2N5VCW5_9BASI|nr:hypothetical protein PCASD_04331 [Puccinia coronata f. sp. avenae]